MARIRTIKPDFFDHGRVAKLSHSARLLMIGLWVFADDRGVIKGNVDWIKARVFPYDTTVSVQKVRRWLKELQDRNFIRAFADGEEDFYGIRNFLKHQKIDKPGTSPNPPIPDNLFDNSTNIRRTFDEPSCPEVGRDRDKEGDKEEDRNARGVSKIAYRELVTITEAQYATLVGDFGKDLVEDMLTELDNYKGAHGKQYKDDYRAIRSWVVEKVQKKHQTGGNGPMTVEERYAKLLKGD